MQAPDYTLLDVLIWAALAAYAGALALSLAGRRWWALVLSLAGVLAGAALLGLLIWYGRRPPLRGPLEGIGEIVFLLGGLAAWDWLRGGTGARAAQWTWAACLALLAVQLLLTRSMIPDSFMFDYPALLLFFQLRLAAIALLLHASSRHLAALGGGRLAGGQLTPGRLLILAGLCAFLGSEFSGAYWSFCWTGEFWHWNRGFLESSALFLVMALPLHLPPRWGARAGLACAAGVLPGVVIAGVTILHQVGSS
ncbi:MAG: hypothetical protein AB1814_08070 [Thermodesulfobacteriota bacterium]